MDHRTEANDQSPLRAAGRVATVAGAVAAVALTLWVGRGGSSLVLMVMFVGWVLAPFGGLLAAERMSGRLSQLTSATLSVVMLVVPLASVALYLDVAVRPRAQSAFMFLVVPPCSWVVMVIATGTASLFSGRRR
jgi:hypothetical protein